jgi:hypothetical protein
MVLSGILNALNIVRIRRNSLQERNHDNGIPAAKTLKEEFLEARSHALKISGVYFDISGEAGDAPGDIPDGR